MPTYLDCINRIQDDMLNRTTLTGAVRRAINTAIRQRERERYWFNETSTALTTVALTETLAHPADLLHLDRLDIVRNSCSTELLLKPFGQIRDLNTNNSPGYPSVYAEYADMWWLANVPDSAYQVNCYYLQKLPVLANDTDTNDWLSAAEDVVVYGAAKLVWGQTIRNISAATVCAQLEAQAVSELRRMRDMRQLGSITPTRF
jgi:hypothetical protein